MGLDISADSITVQLDWTLEAGVAGLNLEGVQDTNDAENADAYDAARALEPDALAEEFRKDWPEIRERMTFRSGGEDIALDIQSMDVPEVGNVEDARTSRVILSGALPEGGAPVVVGWDASLGPLVVRQPGVEGGYSAFLIGGQLSDEIPRLGATDQTAGEAFVDYIGVGFDHIIPLGLDHILFVLGLFFLALRMGALLWQVTAFTLAHTVTLALGALDIVRISPDIVEPLIAASIVYVGIENVLSRGLTPWRPFVVFCFGLLHGLGFASVLQDFGLGADNFIPKLIGFNIGVELGQLSVIAAAYIAFGVLFGNHEWYKRRIAGPVSVGIALIAAFWVLERTGMIGVDGAWAPFSMLTEGGFPATTVTLAAAGLAVVLTILVMATNSDTLREASGMATSFALFLALVATFTSGAWILSLVIAGVWVLAIRMQSLGGADMPGALA
ncbi:HupE/UreJ family protein [Kangsaoukella pontilimi]|nr:HupE/UreJ family protein [Kangsaoukella pontilimi]